jgi:hypothetical protein
MVSTMLVGLDFADPLHDISLPMQSSALPAFLNGHAGSGVAHSSRRRDAHWG